MLRKDLKRKARDVAAGNVVAIYKATPRKRRRFTAGADRVGSYYGRYSGRGAELKFHDVDHDDAVITAGGTIVPTINIIAQGVTESTRVGRKCTIKSIHWRYRINLIEQDAVATPPAGDTVRVMVYLDRQCNDAAAGVTDILETNSWQSFRNLANTSRFQILLDKLVNINYNNLASDNAAVVSSTVHDQDYIFNKKCNIPIEFNNVANDGSLATIRSNNIGTLLVAARGNAVMASKFRLRFSDQ